MIPSPLPTTSSTTSQTSDPTLQHNQSPSDLPTNNPTAPSTSAPSLRPTTSLEPPPPLDPSSPPIPSSHPTNTCAYNTCSTPTRTSEILSDQAFHEEDLGDCTESHYVFANELLQYPENSSTIIWPTNQAFLCVITLYNAVYHLATESLISFDYYAFPIESCRISSVGLNFDNGYSKLATYVTPSSSDCSLQSNDCSGIKEVAFCIGATFTNAPIVTSTSAPMRTPTVSPTRQKLDEPSSYPTSLEDTSDLTKTPSYKPTITKSTVPTIKPTSMPTSTPSLSPNELPMVYTTITLRFDSALAVDAFKYQDALEQITLNFVQDLLAPDWEVVNVSLSFAIDSFARRLIRRLQAPNLNELYIGFDISARPLVSASAKSMYFVITNYLCFNDNNTFADAIAAILSTVTACDLISAPSITPSLMPTQAVSESPSTASFIQTDALLYTCGDIITVSFLNARPDRNDWIGLYPSSSFVNGELPPGAIDWTYACGSQNCSISTSSNVLTFEENIRTTETQGLEDSLQIFLIDDTGAPYTDIIARSDVFQVIGCSNDPSTVPSLIPSNNSTSTPTISTLPTSITTSTPSLAPTSQPSKVVSFDVFSCYIFAYYLSLLCK